MDVSIYIHKGRMKSSTVNQDTFMKSDQMRFIFQHTLSCGLHTFPSLLQCLDPISQKKL